MELLNQPFTGQLGNRLIALLDTTDYQTLNIIVAFAKNSGVLESRMRSRGSEKEVVRLMFMLELTSGVHHTKP